MLLPLLPPSSPVSGTWPAPLPRPRRPPASGALLRHPGPLLASGPARIRRKRLRWGCTAQPAKAAAEAAGTWRQQEAAGRKLHFVEAAFCGCLTFRERNTGAGTGREPLWAGHPHRAPCLGSKKALFLCLLRGKLWKEAAGMATPPASTPGGCGEVDTHLEQVAARLHFALSPCAGTFVSGAGSPGPPTPRPAPPPSQRHPLPLSSGRTSHTLGAGSCAERREAGRGWGENLGVSHNAPLQTA